MSTKVIVKGFQGIKSAEIEIEGLTVLIGPTHSGKSAFYRAIQAALYNDVTSEEIKGSPQGCRIEYQRDDQSYQYNRFRDVKVIHNKEVYQKMNKTTPIEVLTELGFQEVLVEGSKLRPNFYDQLSPLFGTSLTPTMRFSLMMSISECDRLPDVRKDVESDLKESNKQKDILEGVVAEYKKNVELIKWRKEFLTSTEVDVITTNLEKARLFFTVKGTVDDLSVWNDQYSWYLEIEPYLVSLLRDYDRYLSLLANYDAVSTKIDLLNKINSSLTVNSSYLEEINIVLTSIDRVIEGLEKVDRIRELSKEFDSAMESIRNVEAMIRVGATRISDVNKEISEIDTCPVCGAPIKDGYYESVG